MIMKIRRVSRATKKYYYDVQLYAAAAVLSRPTDLICIWILFVDIQIEKT